MKSHILVSWLHPIKEQKLVVIGKDAMAIFDDTKPWNEKLVLYPHVVECSDGLPKVVKKLKPFTLRSNNLNLLKTNASTFGTSSAEKWPRAPTVAKV